MRRKSVWTEGQDAQIRRLRMEGASWEVVALTLRLALRVVMDRARTIGAEKVSSNTVDEAARDPLPAGHAATWRAINRGTLLENVPFRAPGSIR